MFVHIFLYFKNLQPGSGLNQNVRPGASEFEFLR
jgi:hypothetical protein